MYNAKFIIPGLVIAVVIFTAPFWLNLGGSKYVYPELAVPTETGKTKCVEPREFMRAEHMVLLNQWRDAAIRDGKYSYVASDGKAWQISLQNTCMECHVNKAEFCDRCHETNSVNPYCWNCHVEPRGNQ